MLEIQQRRKIMKDFLPILETCTLFEGIRREDLLPMLSCLGARVNHFKKNQILFSEGDDAKFVGIVLSGSVQIIKEDYHGYRSIVSRSEVGELFCESFACAGVATLPVSVVAVEDCAVVFIDSRRICVSCSNACAFHSRTIQNLLKVVAERNLQFHQQMEITAKRTTREKLMAYLLSQAKQAGSDSFTIPYDRQALADFLQVERSAMSAEISKLRKERVLESKKNQFTLL